MKNNTKIPMSRPDIGEPELKSVLDVFQSGWFSEGMVTSEFERLLSSYFSSNVVVVNNGSSALMCALMAHEIRPGDKIVVPAFTFIATSSIPKMLGAEVIVADIDPRTLNVTPEAVEEIVKKTNVKMVIVVDVGGLPVDVEAFAELSKRYGFILVEDAAEALGSEFKNKLLGSFDHTTIFSFHIAKQITTVEGGCIVTKDKKILKKIQMIKDHGRSENEQYVHSLIGSNFRTTDIQSAIGTEQLRKIDSYIVKRNEIARMYKNEIKNLKFQMIPDYVTKHSYMLFFAYANNKLQRDKMIEYLTKTGIDARKSWTPIHMQPCNPELKSIKCVSAEAVFDNVLTLPIYNAMTKSEAQNVIDCCNKF